METEKWHVVEEASNEMEAEILRGLLEAQGFEVLLSQEGTAHYIYPVSVGPFAVVQVLVPSHQFEEAKAVVEAYHQGEFEQETFDVTDEETQDGEVEDDEAIDEEDTAGDQG